VLLKPRMFIASSSERVDLAYAAQSQLGRDIEATVWTQGVFSISKSTFSSLYEILKASDFGLFIFGPDDVVKIRNREVSVVRDNVLFELGMFVGKLGMERCFIVVPSGIDDLHLPTDLAGINPGYFEPDRQDSNMEAALGPVCHQIRLAVRRISAVDDSNPLLAKNSSPPDELVSDENDCVILMQSWMGARSASQNTRAIRFDDVDKHLRLSPGSARKFLAKAAEHWNYEIANQGKEFIIFRDKPRRGRSFI
jgi:hypothetical protein